MAHPVFERVQADVAEGRLWVARDRLAGYLASRPAGGDPDRALELLIELLLQMGDDPAAGKWSYFTEREDAVHERARDAFRRQAGRRSRQVAAALPHTPPLPELGPLAQARLDAIEWSPAKHAERELDVAYGSRLGDVAAGAGCTGCLVVLIGPWIAGLVWLITML